MDVRDSAYRNMAASHKLVVLALACNAEKESSFLHLQAASIGTVFNTLRPKMLAKKNTGYSQRYEPENRVITADLNCSQQMPAEARKGKLFLAISGRTLVLQGCQFQALVSPAINEER